MALEAASLPTALWLPPCVAALPAGPLSLFTPSYFLDSCFSPLCWLHILRSMLSALLLLLAVLSLRTDHSTCFSSSFSTSLMSLFALRSHDSCRGTWEDWGELWGGCQSCFQHLGCWVPGLGC